MANPAADTQSTASWLKSDIDRWRDDVAALREDFIAARQREAGVSARCGNSRTHELGDTAGSG